MADAADVAGQMAEAAAAFLDGLDEGQRGTAAFSFDDTDERRNWGYFPRAFHGLPLLAMDVRQQKLAHRLVSAGLSLAGYARVTAIMALESVLDRIEQHTRSDERDPDRYFLAVFGRPGARDPWGWRFEGHHVSLNFTLGGGEVIAPTPIFLGANPSEVLHGAHPVTRPCADEEDIARELLLSLDAEQRALALICEVAPPDIVLMNEPTVPETRLPGDVRPLQQLRYEHLTPAQLEALRFRRDGRMGLPGWRMSREQLALLDALIDVYIGRLPERLARNERGKVERDGSDGVHFAWAGSAKRREGHYYRLHGPSFIVEYDNTQDGANHVHTVWRDARNDFGEDALRAHLRSAH